MHRTIHLSLVVVAFLMTLMLAHLDTDTHTFRDIFQLQNVPAFILYTSVFYCVLLGMSVFTRAAYRAARRLWTHA